MEVGFGGDDRFLLVVSSAGRGIFNCETGEKTARDYDEKFGDWSDSYRVECLGIGPLQNEWIRMAGLFGGGLARTTHDRWKVECVQLSWPREQLVIEPASCSIYRKETAIVRLQPPISTVQAFGFSPTGRALVAATSSDVTIYWRER